MHSMKLITLLTFTIIFWLCTNDASAQTDSLLYHDLQMESQWGSTTNGDYFGCFVRFTPPSYPARLVGIRAYFRNAGNPSTIKYKVYSNPSGQPNGGVSALYLSPAPLPNPAAGGVANQDYSDYVDLTSQNIIINNGDLYAGVVQNIGFFGIGIDNLPNSSVAPDRQWQWMNVFGTDYWNTLSSQASSGQFGITAFFLPFNTSLPELNEEVQIVYHSSDRLIDIFLMNSSSKILVQLFDVTGRLKHSSTCSGDHCMLNLTGCEIGIYTLVVSDGKRIGTRKIGVF